MFTNILIRIFDYLFEIETSPSSGGRRNVMIAVCATPYLRENAFTITMNAKPKVTPTVAKWEFRKE